MKRTPRLTLSTLVAASLTRYGAGTAVVTNTATGAELCRFSIAYQSKSAPLFIDNDTIARTNRPIALRNLIDKQVGKACGALAKLGATFTPGS